jgi:hypothetical protein
MNYESMGDDGRPTTPHPLERERTELSEFGGRLGALALCVFDATISADFTESLIRGYHRTHESLPNRVGDYAGAALGVIIAYRFGRGAWYRGIDALTGRHEADDILHPVHTRSRRKPMPK